MPTKKKLKKPPAPTQTTSKDIARFVAQSIYDNKGFDIQVLDLRKLASFADYFIIASGTSDRHVQSLSEHVKSALSEKKIPSLGVEGHRKGHWILMDYGSVVAHLFFEEARSFYALEKLWDDAIPVKFRLT